MSLPLVPSAAGVICVQAGVVAAPRALGPRAVRALNRFRGPGWALIPIASIVGVIFAIRYASNTADWLTWLALIAVPLLALAALGWLMHGARWWLAPLAPVLFVLVWQWPGTLYGQLAGALLSGLSCVTLGVLLGAVTPAGWLKLGVIAMACADVWLITTNLLQAPNDVLTAAAPPGGLPQLQAAQFGTVTLGYGDLFVAGLLGAVWSSRPSRQWSAAVITGVLAGLLDLLFFVIDQLPATVPVALALIVMELWARRDRLRERLGNAGQAMAGDASPAKQSPV